MANLPRNIRNLKWVNIKTFSRRNYPLLLAIVFLTPAFILLFLFVNSRIHKQTTQAAPFTGAVRVSKENTTLSTAGGWLKSMAFSGDGINGDGDYFQPIHPGARATTEGAAGTLAVGEVVMPTITANAYDAAGAVFIPWKPNTNGNFYGVTLAVANLNTTAANLNVVVELLRFPTASYTGTPPTVVWSNYVACSAVNTCVYAADTVIERTQVMRFDQSISGEAAYPGQYGIHYMDFRFDPLAVTTTTHYGFRVYYNSLTTASTWPRNGASKPTVNAANFGLGITDVDTANALTVTVPLANTTQSSYAVAINSAPAVGQAAAARTQNEHWSGTYSDSSGNWTIAGSVSGVQTAKLTSSTDGGTGVAWVNDGVTKTTLSADATATTKLCVSSIAGFAVNQYIDIWDADTTSIQRIIASVSSADVGCSNGPSINVTATLAATDKFTLSKNATVARAIWKLRIIQGAEEAFTENMPTTTKLCVADASRFSVEATAGSSNINIWDDNSIIAARRITTISFADASCASLNSITIDTAITAGTYTIDKNARVAEISANFSNNGTPTDGNIFRFTTLNMGQNPAKIGNGNSFVLLYGKTAAPATSAVNYPWIANQRHAFFVAYGDADTTAPADGDMAIIGGGAADPDSGDSVNLSNDLVLGNISPHTVMVDKNFDMPMAYTGATGGGVGSGLTTPATASYGGSGFVSMLISTRAKLAVSDAINQRYRLTAPGRILLSSGASLELGSSVDPLLKTTTVDLYQDSVGPLVSTVLTSDSTTNTYIDMASTAGFYIGDVVMIKDNNSVPTTRIIAAVTSSTRLTFTAAMVAGYTVAQGATVSRGPNTDVPTGADRRSFIYSARAQAARVNMYSQGADDYRTPRADLAVDIDGNIDTGYLGAQQTAAGNVWMDAAGSLAGDWSALDPLSVAQGNSYAVNDNDSSIGMGANDDASVFPTWTGVGSLGTNADAVYNPEQSEIGTIPLTDIYNYDNTGGVFSVNYQSASSWTIFGDGANTENNDAVYFGDQGNTPIYALEFNIGTAIGATASRIWEYWNGSAWTEFVPKFGWKYVPRGTNNYGVGEYCIPFNADPIYPTATVQMTDTNTLFAPGQYVKIKDNDSATIIRRISTVTAGAPANVVFTEIIPSGYTIAQSAKVCISNGGQWLPMAASDLFSQTGRTMISWNAWDMPSAAKTTVNSTNAYWVRNRISDFTSWTTAPINQTTSVSMQGVENVNSENLTVSSSVSEAKISQLSNGVSFDPNETWTLRYDDNSTAVSTLKTTRWYESQLASWGTAHRWLSPNPDGETSAYYEKNSQEANWHSLNGDFSWTDQSVYAKVYMNQPVDATVGRRVGIFLRQDGDDYGYAAYITKSTTVSTLGWYSTALGAETAIGTATNITFNANQWYCLRAEANGTTLQAKFWSPVSEDADCNGDINEPGTWTESEINQTAFIAGRFGLAADIMLARFDDVTVKNTAGTETWFNDNFNDTGCWKVIGSIHGSQGCAYNSVPFTSSYLNFTLKHRGGVQSGETGINAIIGPLNAPEEGDEIYLSPFERGSSIGLDEAVGITTSDAKTKYENWDFVYNSTSGKYDVTGSQYGAAGTATPGATYTSPDSEVTLRIKAGTPVGPKFGNRAAYFQNSFQRGVGNFTGLNNQSSAIIIQPTWVVAGSATGYNVEGIGGVATQKGTMDFWFKPNFSGSPDYIQYLFDYAPNGNTDRIFARIMPNGVIETVVAPTFGVGATGKLVKSFSATAGQWYHFRLAWEDSDAGQLNIKKAWIDGAAFTSASQGTALGARAANAGYLRLGNSWQYNAGFDGAMDEFAIFDDAVDTSSSCDWASSVAFTVPTTPWTNGQTAGCTTGGGEVRTGNIIFLTHFDNAFEKQKGTMMPDYFIGHPAMVFTNGAETLTGDRLRVVTYPKRTRIWMDNTGSQYTPAARIKYSEGYNIGTAPGTEIGWGTTFQYHHRAASDSTSQPITSPILNLRKQIRIWSDEDVNVANSTAPINQGYGSLLYWPKAIDVNHMELSQLYYGFYLSGNPFTTSLPYPTQYIRKSAFNNVQYYNIYTLSKTLGTQVIDDNNFSAQSANYYPFREDTSANITFSNNYVTGYSSGYFNYLNGGRIFNISGNKFLNAYYPVSLLAGTAKVTIANNEFWRFRRGITLNGNSFIPMSGNSFDGGTSSETSNGYYGTGIYVAPSSSNVEVTDSNSTFGKSIWNEADVSLVPDTTSWLAGSLLRYTGENSSFNSNFHYLGNSTQDKFGGEYLATAIPGVDVRMGTGKDIVNYTNYGLMRTTGPNLIDTTVRTSGGYAWRMESTSKTDALEYTAKVVGVAGKPLAITGYIRMNANYGTANLPTVTVSGLGMTGANLSWTASATADSWQQFVISGTPTESALATVALSVKSEPTVADSGTAENVDDGQGINVPTLIEDADKNWTWNQWTGYKMRDDQGFIFDIIGNTATRLLLKGTRIPFSNTLPTQPYGGIYEIYSPPYVYLDDISVLSGTVDTGTLDFYSQGQPVSPWLSTGLTAENIWGAQYSTFADITGSFGQLLNDSLVAKYSRVSDLSPTLTEFDTDLDSATDDFYNNGVIIFTEGLNEGVMRRISDYAGASKTITVDPALPLIPSDNNRFAIIAATASASGSGGGATAAEIWSYVSRTLTDATLNSGSLATAADVANIRADITSVLTELGTGNISAIKTKTDSIDWSDVTGLVTTAGEIKAKTDSINWSDVTGIVTTAGQIKSKTDTIDWDAVTAIKTSTDTIAWSDVTGIITSSGLIQAKTDTINWSDVTGIKTATDNIDWLDISAIKTKTDTIAWSDVTGIKLNTDTISWGDITTIKANVATLIAEIGTGNISAIKTRTDSINWSDVTGIITSAGEIKAKTDTIDWANVTGIKTKTDTIDWDNVTGIKTKTDTIAWGDIAVIQSSIDALNDISAADIWTYATRTITGDVALTADSRKAIWDTACTILNTSGSIGKQVCENLDIKVSEAGGAGGTTLTAADVWNYTTRTITGLTDPALSALASSVWDNATRTLSSYGNDITAQEVWDTLTSSLTTIDSVGKLLVTNVDETISSRATQASVDAMASNLATVLSEIGTGNISAIKTKTDTINWSNVTGLVTTAGEVKLKTDTINWSDIGAIKTSTDTIDWDDITTIRLKTNTIEWGDIADIKSNVAILISEIGTGNISAIKAGTDTISWSDITGLITTSGAIKLKTDTIDWNKVDAIKTKTDTISWDDVTGIKLKTDTINWTNIDTLNSRVDTTISSRASQASLDAHESADATFRTNTTESLGEISTDVTNLVLNVGEIRTSLSAIETKIDTIGANLNSVDDKIDILDTNVDSIKNTAEDTNIKVSAIQTVVNNILNKWGSYSAADIIGYVDALEGYVGQPDDDSLQETLFGRLKKLDGSAGGGGTLDLVYAQVQATHNKLLSVESDLGFEGKTTSAYDEIAAIKNYVDTVESGINNLDSRTSSIASSVSTVSNDLKDVTGQIGKVDVGSFDSIFEVQKTDIESLKNKVLELKALADINRQLLERTVDEPTVKVMMEWGSVIIKFIIVNPSDSKEQKVPFKAYLPKEVRQEYVMDLGGMELNYDTTTEQYYVTADIFLKSGQAITRAVEIKDIWVFSDEEIASIRKQADELSAGLTDNSYKTQAITLKTDINTRLDRIVRKQKDNNATPQDHILAYRENQEEMKAVTENTKALKDLLLNSGVGKNFLASIGGIQTFATWGIVLALIFGMGALGFFYYALWRKKIINANKPDPKEDETIKTDKESDQELETQIIELPTPSPARLVGVSLSWQKKIFTGLVVLAKDLVRFIGYILKKIISLSIKIWVTALILAVLFVGVSTLWHYRENEKLNVQKEKQSISLPENQAKEDIENLNERGRKVTKMVDEINKKAEEKTNTNQKIDALLEDQEPAMDESGKAEKENKLVIKNTPTNFLNVRKDSSVESEIVGKVYPKESYVYSAEKSGWYEIILKDSQKGWVKGQYVELSARGAVQSDGLAAQDTPENQLVVKNTPTGYLNVRDAASAGGALLGKVYPGEKYIFSEKKDGWYKIKIKDDEEGWVIGEYVDAKGPLALDDLDRADKKEVLGASVSTDRFIVIRQTSLNFVNVYEKPSYTERIISKAYPGEDYAFLEVQSGWYRVVLGDKREGWILGEFLKVEDNGKTQDDDQWIDVQPSDGSYVNIRKDATDSSAIVEKIYLSSHFLKLEEKNDWVKIKLLDGNVGWVLGKFVNK